MRPKPDDLQMLFSKYRTMNIEELKGNIDSSEEEEEDNNYSNQHQSLYIAKNVLEIKYKEREKQIELLTESLTSSSRIGRWISSIKIVIKQVIQLNK